jgi:hypothetical protein
MTDTQIQSMMESKFLDRILKQTVLQTSARIPIEHLTLDIFCDQIVRELVCTLNAKVYAETLGAVIVPHEIDLPLNAWHMFKRDYAPHWFKKRFPVKFITKQIDVPVRFEVAYPDYVSPNNLPYTIIRTTVFEKI